MFATDRAELRDCLAEVFYRRGFEMDERIASVAGRLTGATNLKIDTIEARFESDQTAWRVETDEDCQRNDQVLRELCRLSALSERETELSDELTKTMRLYGGY